MGTATAFLSGEKEHGNPTMWPWWKSAGWQRNVGRNTTIVKLQFTNSSKWHCFSETQHEICGKACTGNRTQCDCFFPAAACFYLAHSPGRAGMPCTRGNGMATLQGIDAELLEHRDAIGSDMCPQHLNMSQDTRFPIVGWGLFATACGPQPDMNAICLGYAARLARTNLA